MNYVLIRNGMYHDPLTDLGGATDEGLLSLANDVLDVSGVVNYAGGDLLVEQQVSPNMSVKSAVGRLWIKNDGWTANTRDSSKFFPCLFTASENLTIDANSSGSTRYDLICAKINLAIDPGDNGEYAVTRVVVKGTAGAGVPATPAYHYKIAEVQVVSGATSIVTAKITDRRNQVQFNSTFSTPPTAQVIGSLIAGADDKATPVDTDTVGLSDSAAGNILKKLTWANIKATLKTYFDGLYNPFIGLSVGGWTTSVQTWTRESDNSFSEPIDATGKYVKGDKIRYKQGGTYKYQYIIGVGAYSAGKTIMTTTGGSDYVFTNAVAITDNYYSHQSSPIGFPSAFAFTPVWIGSGGSAGAYALSNFNSRFSINGGICHIKIFCQITNLGSWSGVLSTGALPVTPANFSAETPIYGYAYLPNAVFPHGAGIIASAIMASDIRFWGTVGSAYASWALLSANTFIIINGNYEI